MRILDRTVYIGANVYAHYPVIRLLLNLGPLEDWPSKRLGERFIAPLLAALPGLASHGCSHRAPGGFVRRLREDEGTWMGHILEHVTLELQHLTGAPVAFGKTRATGPLGEYYLVYAYEDVEVGLRAGVVAERFLRSLIPPELHRGTVDQEFDIQAEISGLVALARERAAVRATAESAAATPAETRIVIVAGADDPSHVAGLLAMQLSAAGHHAEVAAGSGAWDERSLIQRGPGVAILATTRRLLEETGLGTTHCDAAAVLGALSGDQDPLHLPLEIARRSTVFASGLPPAAAATALAALLAAS